MSLFPHPFARTRPSAAEMTGPSWLAGGRCAVCDTATNKICGGCREMTASNPGAPKTHYCSPECRVADESKHKSSCRQLSEDERRLFQAVILLKRLWMVFRVDTFNIHLDKVEVKDENIHLYETVSKHAGIYGESFPHQLFTNSRVTDIVLSDMCCVIAAEAMAEITKTIMSGICDEFNAMSVHSKHVPVVIFHQRYYNHGRYDQIPVSHCKHEIYVVRLESSGEDYVIDLTGAQYGCFDTVMPRTRYEADHLEAPPGPKIDFDVLPRSQVMNMNNWEFNAKRVHVLLQLWLSRNHMTALDLILMDKPTFAKRLEKLEAFVTVGLADTRIQAIHNRRLLREQMKGAASTDIRKVMEKRKECWKKAGIVGPGLERSTSLADVDKSILWPDA